VTRTSAIAVAAASLLFAAAPSQAVAATINVACGDVADLVNTLQTASSGDTVKLGNGCTYTLTAPYSGVDGLPPIATTLTLDGRGSTIARTSAPGTALFRILHVGAAGNLTLEDVTLTNGELDNFPGQNGGGILNEGTLSMDGVTVTANKAFQGGGVNSTKTLSMTNSVVSDNLGTDHGGGIHLYGNTTITDSEVVNNDAWILAGGINSGGPLTLTRTTVSGNTAGSGGGVIAYVGGNAPLTLDDSDVTGNTALGSGGIFSYGSTIWITNGSTVNDNVAQQDCGGISSSGAIVVVSSTVSGNEAAENGGGICSGGSLTLSSSTVSGNRGLFGGGVYSTGSMLVYRSTLSGNTADQDGGAIRATGSVNVVESTLSGNTGFFGGAVKSYGTLTINRSTVAGNSAAFGGGVAILFSPAEATVVNSTFWGNTGTVGGGILTYGALRVLSSTIASNAAWQSAGNGGGIHVVYTGSSEIRNSIVVNNVGASPNVEGTVTSFGHNVVGDTTGSSGWVATDNTGVANPGLASGLASNGGPTQTVALLSTSPARDAVPNAACVNAAGGPLYVDQRFFPRPSGSACDAGAFERFTLLPPLP
jgi:predicted outer membrane repeat protein